MSDQTMHTSRLLVPLVFVILGFVASGVVEARDWISEAEHRVVELENFEFQTGETLPSISMSVYTLGSPRRDEQGEISNAVMLLHGTGGSGKTLLRSTFGDELFGPGQLLDIEQYYIISPGNLGHGDSSKPSDGMRAAFPKYDYDDMVRAQHRMLTEGLGVRRLELILGTSMGCMHSFLWGIDYPGFARRLMPLACNAIEIAGRNRVMRQIVIDGFATDPAYRDGNYAAPKELLSGQRIFANMLILAGSNPYGLQADYPTREASVELLRSYVDRRLANPVDPNDTMYQFDASRNYNPAPRLAEIEVPVLWINSADDFINPAGLGNPEALAARMPNARFVLIPASEETRGHGTHSAPQFWKDELAELLAKEP